MNVPCLPLFAPLGTLQRRTPEYYRIHASLVESYRRDRASQKSKRERAQGRSKIWKQRGEIDAACE